MFYNYEIKNGSLFLFLTMKYEYSNEFSIHNDVDLARRTKNFIKNNHIPYRGNHIYLVVDGVVVKSLNLNNNNNNYNTIPLSTSYDCDSFMINIKLKNGAFCEMTLREYLQKVLCSFYKYDLEDEVLKSIGVLYNTYAYKTMKENNYIDENDYFGRFNYLSFYKDEIPNYDNYLLKINSIISNINCIYLSYQNNYILPFLHFSNYGKTLANKHYKYLASVDSIWDLLYPNLITYKDYTYKQLEKIFNISFNKNTLFKITTKDNRHFISIDSHLFTLEEVENKLSFCSSKYYFLFYNDFLRVINIGNGHFYGLSLFGSNEMAKNGVKYYNILKYYFPKVKLFQYNKKLS